MSSRLPERIEPWALAEKGANLAGELDLGRMKRLSSSLWRATGTVTIELQFDKDEHGRRFVTGEWATRLWLICPRCLEPMEIALSRELRLEFLQGLQAWGMSSDFEPMQVVESETVSLLEMVEDELILALPMVPVHAIGDCLGTERGMDNGSGVKNENPFGTLAKLKSERKTPVGSVGSLEKSYGCTSK